MGLTGIVGFLARNELTVVVSQQGAVHTCSSCRLPTQQPLRVCKAQPRVVKIVWRDIEEVANFSRTARLRILKCGNVRMVVECVKCVSGAYADIISR